MVWYFNFCSPHLNDDNQVNLNRTIMVILIVLAMLITFIVHMFAELYDKEPSRVKKQDDLPQEGHNQKAANIAEQTAMDFKKSYDNFAKSNMQSKNINKMNEPGFFKNQNIFFLTVQTVQNKAPCFLGHFAIALASCAMYSPFLMQTLMGICYLLFVIFMLFFQAWKYQRMITISVAASYLINLALLTSAVVGVGLTNWDPFSINCYYTKLKM